MKARTVGLLLSYGMAAMAGAAVTLSPLPRSAALLVLGAVGLGAAWDRDGRHRVPGRILTGLGLTGFIVSLLPLHRETLAEQSLAALCYLLAVKLLAPKRRRDHLQMLAVSLLLVAGAASLEPELRFAAILPLVLLLGVFQLVWLPFSEQPPQEPIARGLLRRLVLISGILAALSLPLAVLLFIILPRSANPLWFGWGGQPRQEVSGMSDHLRLGEVSSLALSRNVAFRAELEDQQGPLPDLPYWRGAVLEETDGRAWSTGDRHRPSSIAPSGRAIRISYYVEPHNVRQLFLLETPASATISARTQLLGSNRVLRLPTPLVRRLRYRGFSIPSGTYAEKLTGEERARNVRLPPGLPTAIPELARSIAGGEGDPQAAARRLLEHFSRGYTYALEVPRTTGDPLEDFLLGHRTGYCEYFAAALTVLLRAIDIPARIVSGYLGGEYNEDGNYYLVTQAASHAWVEAYLDGRWVRLDPTPAAGRLGGTFASRRARGTILWLDGLRMRWNSWIIQFDAESQMALARRGGAGLHAFRPSLRRIAVVLAVLLAGIGLLGIGAILRRRKRFDPLEARYRRFSRIAMQAGTGRMTHEGPLDHAVRFGDARPAHRIGIRRFGELYAACRYGNRSATADLLREMDHLIKKLGTRNDGRGARD